MSEVYTVWGGYPEQDEGDHWATFRSLEYARAYREEQLRLEPRLNLAIITEKASDDEAYADDEWDSRFNPCCTSGCATGSSDLCGLCEPFFLGAK
jgi:hypothetical protein